MAVTADTNTPFIDAGATTNITWSHTVASNATDLSVRVMWSRGDTVTITGVTWGGVSLTAQGSIAGGVAQSSRIYTLGSPTSGSQNVVVSFTGTADVIAGLAEAFIGSFGFSGVTNASGTSTTPSVTVSGVQTGDLVIDALVTASSPSVGADQTQEYNPGSVSSLFVAASRQNGANGGVMSWSQTSSAWVISAINVSGQPPSVPPGPVDWEMLHPKGLIPIQQRFRRR